MGSAALATVRASIGISLRPRRSQDLRILDLDQHKAWREFLHWWECRAARGSVPSTIAQLDKPRQSQRKPSIEDRYIWAIDMERSFLQLAPAHRGILQLLARGDSLAIAAHTWGVSVRTLLRRRDAALVQLAQLRRRYVEEA